MPNSLEDALEDGLIFAEDKGYQIVGHYRTKWGNVYIEPEEVLRRAHDFIIKNRDIDILILVNSHQWGSSINMLDMLINLEYGHHIQIEDIDVIKGA
jgi:hypothetical protein